MAIVSDRLGFVPMPTGALVSVGTQVAAKLAPPAEGPSLATKIAMGVAGAAVLYLILRRSRP